MASDLEMVTKAALAAGEGVSWRKMFGEYAFYYDGKVYALMCDNRFLVKMTPSSQELLKDCPIELPYAGSKPAFRVDDIENTQLMGLLKEKVSADLPQPKKKKSAK